MSDKNTEMLLAAIRRLQSQLAAAQEEIKTIKEKTVKELTLVWDQTTKDHINDLEKRNQKLKDTLMKIVIGCADDCSFGNCTESCVCQIAKQVLIDDGGKVWNHQDTNDSLKDQFPDESSDLETGCGDK